MANEERGLGDEVNSVWERLEVALEWSPDEFIAGIERLIAERTDFYDHKSADEGTKLPHLVTQRLKPAGDSDNIISTSLLMSAKA